MALKKQDRLRHVSRTAVGVSNGNPWHLYGSEWEHKSVCQIKRRNIYLDLELEVVYFIIKLFYIIEIIIWQWHLILNRLNFHSLRKEQLF